jgi:hypothetical protein
MSKVRLLMNLLTLAALAYAVLLIKGFLNKNFVENETPIKHSLNDFLNGKVPTEHQTKDSKDLTQPRR